VENTLNHVFIEQCGRISPVIPYYYALFLFWILLTLLWTYLVYFKFKRYSLYMQKVMVLFPFCKCLDTLINGLFLNACPWVSNFGDSSGEKYIDMARITIVTITYTIFLALIYLICKGWNTLNF
jgi:hypothetical protein